MLVGNGIRLASGPGRFNVSGTTFYAAERVASDPYGARKNVFIGEGEFDNISGSQPSGYGHPYCWLWAIKAGGLACRNVIEGTSELTADLLLGKDLSADLSGVGIINSADLTLSTGLSADLAGIGTIDSADMVGTVQCSADLTGIGTVTADCSALAGLTADLTGVGTITANAFGTADMSADLTVTASVEFPTADEITTAVWAKIVEAGYTTEDILKLLAAANLGESSGGPGTPAYKGLDNSTTRVTGTVDTNGNRSAITLTP